jgi:ABC-type transport system involved in multi-copper enzyme maturation permease subunit
MMKVVRSEILKLRTTNVWWLFGIGIIAMTALAFLFNAIGAHFQLHPQQPDFGTANVSAEERAQAQTQYEQDLANANSTATLLRVASTIYTSGQFFGVLFILILGALIVTNEFAHQTATATFLTTPHRTKVIVGKLFGGVIMAAFFWLITTVLDVIAGAIFLSTQDRSNALGEWSVQRSILLNLAAYACWAVLGIGLGVLIRSQIGAVVTGAVLYLIGTIAGQIVFQLIRSFLIKKDWVITTEVILPAVASQVMTTVGQAFDHAPPQWVGAVVLIGYGILFGVIGTLITRKRDIS